MRKWVLIAAGLAAIVAVGATLPPVPKPSVPAVAIDRSPAMQADRKKLIEKLIASGVFIKLEQPGSLPRIHTGRRWLALAFDEKQQFVSVVAAYAGNADNGYLTLVYDGATNKQVGRYADTYGGLSLD